MKYILILCIVLSSLSASTQNIAIYNAYIKERPLVISPVIGYSTFWGHQPNVVFELSYDLNEKLALGARYFYDDYSSFVGYLWTPSDKNNAGRGHGQGGAKMIRLGIFGEYNLIEIWNRVSISGRLYLDYQSYDSQFREPDERTKVGDIKANYSGPDRGETFLTTYDKWQLLPSVGLSLSYRPFWKVVLHAEAFYSHGFVAHSRLEFEYTDLEIEQPTAEFIGNGTSFTYSFGLGFRLWE